MTQNQHPPTSDDAGSEDQRFPYWRRNLRVLPLANLLCSMGFALSWPFLPLMARSLGIVENLETWMGNLMLVFYIIGFVSAPLWGSIADHYGRKIMVLRAMMGMGFFMTLVPFAQTPIWFALLLLMVGAFNGFLPAGLSLLVANTPPQRIGRALSMAQTGALVGGTMGPALGATIAALLSERHAMFWLSGGLLLSGGFLVLFFVREVKQLAEGPWRPRWLGSLRELARVPGVVQLLFLAFMGSILWNGNVTILSIYTLRLLADHPDAAHSEAYWVGAVAMALTLSSVVAAPLWGRVLDRYQPARVLSVSVGLAALTTLPLMFVQTPLQLTVSRVAFGLAAAAMVPAIIRLLKDYAPKGMDARAISYASSFQLIAMGIAPFLAGMIGPWLGLRAYFLVVVLLTLSALVLWLRRGRSD
jgi:DHA1 family multidrug resistance protein-like MFS transporter